MKVNKKLIYAFGSALLFVSCTPKQNNIVISDFESGTYGDWKVEGDAFGKAPATKNALGQQEIVGFKGKYFVNSYSEETGDNARGTLTSPVFKIEKDYINFLIAGGKSTDTYIELLIDGKSVARTSSLVESETLHALTWDVKQYKGKDALIRIVDWQRGPWGHIVVDQIEQSDKPASDMKIDFVETFKVDKKYLLIPIEEKAPELRVTLSVEGQSLGTTYNFIRFAQTKVDYYVPFEVEAFKGKNLSITFDQVKESYVGLKELKLSDSFDFEYAEKYRPIYHFSPKYGWTNDPNGMVYANGKYHLYYQHNPYGSMWGNMSWGHASTKDLINWEHHPVAIRPDSLGAIFSGSAVVDKNNTTGFGKDAIVALYTSSGTTQTQSLGYSHDGGITFTKHNGNPVLTDPAYIDFRDPKVFWHEGTKQWIMSLATTQVITFYSSPDLKEWTKLSDFGTGIGDHGGVWECPDLFPLTYNGKTKWVLIVSINPGGPNGGSASQYFIGDFDGKTFKADELPYPLWLDYGRDNYAGVTWADAPDNRRVFIGWMSNWDYTNQAPTVHFRNGMTIPREMSLGNNGKHMVLKSEPVKEVLALRKETKTIGNFSVDKSYKIDELIPNNEGGYEIELTVTPNTSNDFALVLSNAKGEKLVFDFDLKAEQLKVDRSKSGLTDFSATFSTGDIVAPLVKKNTYKIRLLVDKASTEIFVNDGEVVQTNTMFPSEVYNTLEVTSDASLNVSNCTIYRLK